MDSAIHYVATGSLLEPSPQSVVTRGMLWVENLAFGSIATIVAVLAVAMTGMLLLSGRLDLRRGATVILGCFILFGARSIAQAFLADPGVPAIDSITIAPPEPPIIAAQPAQPRIYDPYAGAATPQVR
ncbi:TrbC/VirB2 family protein [Sphingobium fuliginis]|uniref:Type VI secretion protein n=1 Tax=Sphingobium fuliginis ATCC 27551 TaxID=1208342 RepID=A0A5B8CI18_SPHSA|nr:hypothetical protein FIL70_03000 [Sphingobium fuliginis ATCC 27551]